MMAPRPNGGITNALEDVRMEETNHSQEFAAKSNLNKMSNDSQTKHKRQLIQRETHKNKTIHPLKATPGEPPADQAAD
jgi:hypothetical protein